MSKYHMNKPNLEVTDSSFTGELISRAKFITIAMCDKAASPYIVTLSCGWDEKNNCFYFHCSNKGHKLDVIKENPLVCATIIDDGGYVKGDCSHLYKTAVIWGKMKIIAETGEKIRAFDILFSHLEDEPDKIKSRFISGEKAYDGVCVLKLEVDKIDCKSNIKNPIIKNEKD